MSTEANFTIPEEILQDFAAMKPGEDNGQDPAQPAAGPGAMYGVNQFLSWFVETADGQAKQMGYPGTGQVPPERLADLYAIVAERNLSPELMAKTPEAMALSITAGILGINYIHYQKTKKQEAAAAAQESQENNQQKND